MNRKIAFTIRKNNNLFYTNILLNKVAMKISCCVGRYNPDLEKSADEAVKMKDVCTLQNNSLSVFDLLSCRHR